MDAVSGKGGGVKLVSAGHDRAIGLASSDLHTEDGELLQGEWVNLRIIWGDLII